MTAIAAVAFVGTTALAATQTTVAAAPAKKAAKKNKKATPATAEAAPAAPVAAPVAQVAPAPAVEVAPAAATSGGQSTVAAPSAEAAAPTKRFSGKITDRAAVNVNSTNRALETTEAEGTLDPRLGYKLSDSTSVGLGTTVVHTFGALSTGKAGWTVTDIFGQVQNSNLATLPGGVKLKAGGRVYAPTSEVSQASGQMARVRGELTLEKAVGPVTLSYYASPQVYMQRNNTYVNAKGEVEATRNFRYLHYLGAAGNITPKLSAYTQIGLDQGVYNEDSSKQIQKNARTKADIYTETALEYAINDNVSVAAGVGQEAPDMLAQSPNAEGPLYRDEFTSYFLEGTVSF
jgi:hypothetical protein